MIPRVSIGMPVFNGENFLEDALGSLLRQTFGDFEIIISDNASMDRTGEICRDYMARDRRIRYYRNDRNFGAAWNFNRVFQLAGGEYFKWAAHDDICGEDFLLKCVEALDRDPLVVLCYPKVRLIDKNGICLRVNDESLSADSLKPQDRFYRILHANMCYEIFGLIRSSVLRFTTLMGNHPHGDGVLLARLGLLGRFEEISEPLFFSRRHPRQAGSRLTDRYHWVAWFDPNLKGRIAFPHWRIFWEYLKTVHQTPLNLNERACCYLHLGRWLVWYRKKLADNLVVGLRHGFKTLKTGLLQT